MLLCSWSASADSLDADFPVYDSIRPNVEFWESVWGEWTLGQVAVHDREYPGVVYQVANLPGKIDTRLTEDQREFIDDLKVPGVHDDDKTKGQQEVRCKAQP